MMKSCPIDKCGRKFDQDQMMLEHIKRRHFQHYESVKANFTKTLIEREHAHQSELSKLPKLAKIMSKEKKTQQIIQRSSSKNKKPVGGVSNIIEESRKMVSGTKVVKRPSLQKKNTTEGSFGTLPSITSHNSRKNKIQLERIQTTRGSKEKDQKIQTQQNFYTTAPSFHPKKKTITVRSKSKERRLKGQKEKTIASDNIIENMEQQKKQAEIQVKTHYRPLKKSDKNIYIRRQKQSSSPKKHSSISEYNFGQRTVVVNNWNQKCFTCPQLATVESLFVNNCGIAKINLNNLQTLIELSATHNNIQNMDFLKYSKNVNIRVLHLDYNKIQQVYTPPQLRIFTLSFNKLVSTKIEYICANLRKSPHLEEIDFSFNNIRKAPNYKMQLLTGNQKLKSIDGLKVTKIDKEMVNQFRQLYAQEKGLIPLGSPSSSKERPSTGISELVDEQMEKSAEQLSEECKQLQILIKRTKEQVELIEKENEIINEQIMALDDREQEGMEEVSLQLYEKLMKECQSLELLNFLQYASNDELKLILEKKENE